MKNQQAQRRIIAAALFPTIISDSLLSSYQQLLAEQYVQGTLTIQHAVALLKEYQHRQTPAQVE